ncbi:MAG: hypothetical protein ABFS86_13800, partial [Planctomycetota bacterium]
AQHAPESEKVEKCLAALAECDDPKMKGQFDWPVKVYRQRVKGETGVIELEPATPVEPEDEEQMAEEK